jgi:hypothetical protein
VLRYPTDNYAKVVCNSSESNLTIGVANEHFEKDSIPEYGNFWGISPYTGSRVTPNAVDQYEQAAFKNGDSVGMLLEYKNQMASLRFFVNNAPVDADIEGLTGTLYPVVSFMSSLGSATLVPAATLPPGV